MFFACHHAAVSVDFSVQLLTAFVYLTNACFSLHSKRESVSRAQLVGNDVMASILTVNFQRFDLDPSKS